MHEIASYQTAIDSHAARFAVASAIHPEDHIFNFVFNHPGFPSRDSAISYYFSDGANSAEQFVALLAQHSAPSAQLPSVLEFASGYGCVTRHLALKKSFVLRSCDIHPQANRFVERELDVGCIQSSSCPESLRLPRPFDVVFALSFFSHMPLTTWSRWLVRLIETASPGGLIIFTTHGAKSRPHFGNPEICDLGFWFKADSEQADLPFQQYGQTITMPTFVLQNIASIPGAELVEMREGYWWSHQDLYVLRRRDLP
jgi:SAM-dependent methyltransferase